MSKPTILTDAALGFATNRPILHGAVLVGALLAFTLPASAGHMLKVDINDSDCSDDPRSFGGGDPFCSIQAAIDDAMAGDRIKVKGKGVLFYDENIVIDKPGLQAGS